MSSRPTLIRTHTHTHKSPSVIQSILRAEGGMRRQHNQGPNGPGVRWAVDPAVNPASDVTVCRDRPVVVKINRGPTTANPTARARRKLIEDQFRQVRDKPTYVLLRYTHNDDDITLFSPQQPLAVCVLLCSVYTTASFFF